MRQHPPLLALFSSFSPSGSWRQVGTLREHAVTSPAHREAAERTTQAQLERLGQLIDPWHLRFSREGHVHV